MARFAGVALSFGLTIVSASCVLAQTPVDTLPLSCADATSAARGQSPQSSRAHGLSELSRCPLEFGEVAAELWAGPPLPTDAMNALQGGSQGMRDRRIFSAVADVAQNGGAPVQKRLAALLVLVAYLEPGSGLSAEDMTRGGLNDPIPHLNHSNARDGAQPLGDADREAAVKLFSDLAANGSPDDVRRAGLYLRQAFISRYPAATPLAPDAVTATWDCRGNLKLTNATNIDLPLALADSAGTAFNSFTLHRPGTAWPSTLTVGLTKTGPLTVLYGGKPLVTLGCH